MKKLYWIFTFLFLLGCGGDNTASTEESVEDPSSEEAAAMEEAAAPKLSEDVIADILKSIPSPLEISYLIKEIGAEYNNTLLNNPDFVNNYNTEYNQSLNLGVYSTDLGYANLYGKNQDVLNYLNSVKKLADDIKIGQFFDYATIKRLAQSSNNLDSLLQQTQKNLESINDHLREQRKENLTILILTGGWVEAVYLTTLIYQKSKNFKLKEKIGEQKIALDQIMLVLEIYKNKPNVSTLLIDLKELQKVYNRVEIKEKKGKSIMKEKNGELIIEQETVQEIVVNEADIEMISSLLKSIRNKIIK